MRNVPSKHKIRGAREVMTWLVLTVLAILSRAVYGVLTKVLSNHVRVSVMTQTALLMVAATTWALVLSPFVGGIHVEHVHQVWLALVIAIVTSALGNMLYFKGIAKLESGTTQIAFSSILVWSVIMAWIFLGTHLTVVQSFGVALLLGAILLAQYRKGSFKFNHSIWLIILSAACFAGFQISSAHLARTLTPGTYLVLTYLGDAILIGAPYLAIIRHDLAQAQSTQGGLVWSLVLTGGMSVGFNVFAYLAYGAAPNAGLVVLLLTSQVVVAVILSIIFLNERINIGHKLSAGVLTVVAALLIKS